MNDMIKGVSSSALPEQIDNKGAVTQGDDKGKFADALKDAIAGVNDAQNNADKATEKMANGDMDDLHNVMIAGQKASTALETGVQVQSKVIDAYNEIMKMQV